MSKKVSDQSDDLFGSDVYRRLELMRSAARTRRCHTQMVIHGQGVGEHTFGALAILDLVAPNCGKVVWRALLYHDSPEAITGDVPAPAKWQYPELERVLKYVEGVIRNEHGISVELTREQATLVKYADMMELIWYCIEEIRMGNLGVKAMAAAAIAAMRKRDITRPTLKAHQLFEYTVSLFNILTSEKAV